MIKKKILNLYHNAISSITTMEFHLMVTIILKYTIFILYKQNYIYIYKIE